MDRNQLIEKIEELIILPEDSLIYQMDIDNLKEYLRKLDFQLNFSDYRREYEELSYAA